MVTRFLLYGIRELSAAHDGGAHSETGMNFRAGSTCSALLVSNWLHENCLHENWLHGNWLHGNWLNSCWLGT